MSFRERLAPPAPPARVERFDGGGDARAVWEHFQMRHVETFGTVPEWDGSFPCGAQNRRAIGELLELAGDVRSACSALDLLFAEPEFQRLGVALYLGPLYWPHLGSSAALAARLRQLERADRRSA
jgi:hypothetical protein